MAAARNACGGVESKFAFSSTISILFFLLWNEIETTLDNHDAVASARVDREEMQISKDMFAANRHRMLVVSPKALENRNRALLANAIPTSGSWRRPRNMWHTDEHDGHQNGVRIQSLS